MWLGAPWYVGPFYLGAPTKFNNLAMESCDLRPLCMCGPFLNGALAKFSNLRLGIYGIWGTFHVAPFWPGAWQNLVIYGRTSLWFGAGAPFLLGGSRGGIYATEFYRCTRSKRIANSNRNKDCTAQKKVCSYQKETQKKKSDLSKFVYDKYYIFYR